MIKTGDIIYRYNPDEVLRLVNLGELPKKGFVEDSTDESSEVIFSNIDIDNI